MPSRTAEGFFKIFDISRKLALLTNMPNSVLKNLQSYVVAH
jgi:hypothetical protein